MSGNFFLSRPLQERARLDLQVLCGLACREPFAFHVETPFPDASAHPKFKALN
jgi:hypothetical protein